MIIEYKDYLMEADKEGGFHLKKKIIATKKDTGEKYDDVTILGYNMQLKNCASKIAHLELCNVEGTYTLKEAVKIWNDKLEEIKNAINL